QTEPEELLMAAETAAVYGKGRKGKQKSRPGKKTETDVSIAELEKEMMTAAKNLEFEKAARLRDMISRMKS
ncbi:MAG TPA: UvrB/UvrC motif-containing protein, partial [Chitinispirillaceae bacterium]|nr:UvrB/UvrC motif-containing protein [Chitinispirillaceae bacterium]